MLSLRIVDKNGKVVATAEAPAMWAEPGRTVTLRSEAAVQNPLLWSLEEPNLYRVVSTLEDADNGRTTDQCITAFGIRTLKFDPQQGFFLNGKPVKLKGTCNHQDHAGVGAALPDRLHYWRIEKLKEMG